MYVLFVVDGVVVDPSLPAAVAADGVVEDVGGGAGAVAPPVVPGVAVVGELEAVLEELHVGEVEAEAGAVGRREAHVVDERGGLEEGEVAGGEAAQLRAGPRGADAVVFAAEGGVVEALKELDAVEFREHRRLYQLVYLLFVSHAF